MADTFLGALKIAVEGEIGDFRDKMQQVIYEVDNVGGAANKMVGLVSQGSLALIGIGGALTAGVTQPIMQFAEETVNAGMEFDQTMSQVQAVTMATTEEFKALRDQALLLGKETQFSSRDAASAMAELSKAGLEVNEVQAAMPSVLNLAAAGMLDMEFAATIVARSMNTFGETADETTRYADVLAYAANKSATSVQGLGEALSYGGPSASQMGYSLEQTIGIMSMFSNQGIDSTRAGTAFEAMMRDLQRTALKNDGALKAMTLSGEELSVAWYDSTGKTRDFADILGDLEKAMAGMTPEEEKHIVNQLARTQAQRGLNALLQTGSEELRTFTNALYDSNGVGEETAKIMRTNLAGAFEQMDSSIETMQVSFNDILTPVLWKFADAVRAVADWVAGLPKPMKIVIVILAAVAAAIGPILLLIGGVGLLLPAITIGLEAITAALAGFMATALPVIAVIAGIAAAGLILWEVFKKLGGQTLLWQNEVKKTYKPLADISEVTKQAAKDTEDSNRRIIASYQDTTDKIQASLTRMRGGFASKEDVDNFLEEIKRLRDTTLEILTNTGKDMSDILLKGFASSSVISQEGGAAIVKALIESNNKQKAIVQEGVADAEEIYKTHLDEKGKLTAAGETKIMDRVSQIQAIGLNALSDSQAKILALEATTEDARYISTAKSQEKLATLRVENAKKELDDLTIWTGQYIAALDIAYEQAGGDYAEYVALKNEAADRLIAKQIEVAEAEAKALGAQTEAAKRAKADVDAEIEKMRQDAVESPGGVMLLKFNEEYKALKKESEGYDEIITKAQQKQRIAEAYTAELYDQMIGYDDYIALVNSFGYTVEQRAAAAKEALTNMWNDPSIDANTRAAMGRIASALGDGKIIAATEGKLMMDAMNAEIAASGVGNSAYVKALEVGLGLQAGTLDTPEKAKAAMQAFIDSISGVNTSEPGLAKGAEASAGINSGFENGDAKTGKKGIGGMLTSLDATLSNMYTKLKNAIPGLSDLAGILGFNMNSAWHKKMGYNSPSQIEKDMMKITDNSKRFLRTMSNDIRTLDSYQIKPIGDLGGNAMLEQLTSSVDSLSMNPLLTAGTITAMNTQKQVISYEHSGTLQVQGVNDSNQFVDVVDIIVDQLRKEVRTV